MSFILHRNWPRPNSHRPPCDCNHGVLPNVQLHVQPGTSSSRTRRAGSRRSAIYPLLEAPTGDAARGRGTGRTHAFVPLWVQKDFGDWTTYGGGGYWINPGPATRTSGSRVGCWSARSPTNLRSASHCSIRRPMRSAVCRRPVSTSAACRRRVSCGIYDFISFPFFVWKRSPARQGDERIFLVYRVRSDRRRRTA